MTGQKKTLQTNKTSPNAPTHASSSSSPSKRRAPGGTAPPKKRAKVATHKTSSTAGKKGQGTINNDSDPARNKPSNRRDLPEDAARLLALKAELERCGFEFDDRYPGLTFHAALRCRTCSGHAKEQKQDPAAGNNNAKKNRVGPVKMCVWPMSNIREHNGAFAMAKCLHCYPSNVDLDIGPIPETGDDDPANSESAPTSELTWDDLTVKRTGSKGPSCTPTISLTGKAPELIERETGGTKKFYIYPSRNPPYFTSGIKVKDHTIFSMKSDPLATTPLDFAKPVYAGNLKHDPSHDTQGELFDMLCRLEAADTGKVPMRKSLLLAMGFELDGSEETWTHPEIVCGHCRDGGKQCRYRCPQVYLTGGLCIEACSDCGVQGANTTGPVRPCSLTTALFNPFPHPYQPPQPLGKRMEQGEAHTEPSATRPFAFPDMWKAWYYESVRAIADPSPELEQKVAS